MVVTISNVMLTATKKNERLRLKSSRYYRKTLAKSCDGGDRNNSSIRCSLLSFAVGVVVSSTGMTLLCSATASAIAWWLDDSDPANHHNNYHCRCHGTLRLGEGTLVAEGFAF